MACLTAKFTRVGDGVKLVISPVCGTSVGEKVMFDKDGRMLLDKNGLILTTK